MDRKRIATSRSHHKIPFLLSITILTVQVLAFAQGYPAKDWERVKDPGRVGWSVSDLKKAQQYASTIQTAGVMVVLDGKVLYEWGDISTRYNVHSIRKSFLSALYGIYIKEGLIDPKATMRQLGIDDNEPSLTDVEKGATIMNLLRARSGVYHAALYETASMKAARPKRGSHAPDTFWYYNNWDFNALGMIFERQTKNSLFREYKARIADPIGMQDFRLEDCQYVTGPDSVYAAYPFRMTARDMARFGLLFLRRGSWRGKSVIPADWVDESTKSYSDAGGAGGYGYLWWTAVDGRHLPHVKLDGAYSARGAGGHYILVIPNQKLVIVHRVNTDMQGHEVSGDQFGQLVKLILDARKAMP
jgi:CubicO group peptidase (beta-lactamase class C family)